VLEPVRRFYPSRRAQYLTGENIKVVWAEFSTLSWAVLLCNNVVKIPWQLTAVIFSTNINLTILGLKYYGNLLSNCSNVLPFQGKFNVLKITTVI
jgi:hypothetical protein